jgi:hypothetical protein
MKKRFQLPQQLFGDIQFFPENHVGQWVIFEQYIAFGMNNDFFVPGSQLPDYRFNPQHITERAFSY